jgi:AraC-like DNA-binding protein
MNFYKGLRFPFFDSISNGHKRRHIPLYYGIQFNESNTLHLKIGNHKKRSYTGAWVFITHPGTEFTYEIAPNVHHPYWAICFIGPRVKKYLNGGLLSLAPRAYPIHDPERFRKTIYEFVKMHKKGQYDFCTLLLENLLLQIHCHTTPNSSIHPLPWQHAILNQLTEKILLNPVADWNFDAEAEAMHISPRHFRTIFKKVNRMPPLHFLLKTRLELAAIKLHKTQDPIGIIALESGFQDEFYFSRLFKKYYMLSPKQYRMEVLNSKDDL